MGALSVRAAGSEDEDEDDREKKEEEKDNGRGEARRERFRVIRYIRPFCYRRRFAIPVKRAVGTM